MTPTMTLAPSATPTHRPVVPTSAPTPTPTATAAPTEAPSTGDGSLSQAVTSTVAMSETLTTAPTLAPPAPTINTKDIYERLWRLNSFVVDVVASLDTGETPHTVATRVNTPSSWRISFAPYAQGEDSIVTYVLIGARSWAEIGDGQVQFSCDDPAQLATNDLERTTCELGAGMPSVVQTALGILSNDQVAELVDENPVIDAGPRCHEYEWRDADAALWSMCMSPETGLPTRVSSERITMQFNRYNDPENAIAPPTSAMPERLHIDDARMAYNGLSSFRYVTDAELSTSAAEPSTYHVEGVYVQNDQAWQTEWKWKPQDLEPVFEVLSIEDQTWLRIGQNGNWVDSSLLEDFEWYVSDAGPFAYWPDASEPAAGVGILQSDSTRTVDGLECVDYLFEGTRTTETGVRLEQRIRVCITPIEMLPLQVEITLEFAGDNKSARVAVRRELSHINDPANLVESPQR